MRILLIGCVQSSILFLQKMIEKKMNIVGVVTKSQSEFNADYADLGLICRKKKIDYIYAKNANSSETKNYIQAKNPDWIFCLGWSELLDKEILDIPRCGSIGFHPAELPYNKGRHPIIWALALGLQRTASTFFLLNEFADEGKIISQQHINIEYKDDAETLYRKIMNVAIDQFDVLLCNLSEGIEPRIISTNTHGNSWRKRKEMDGIIDWRMSSRGIYNLVRALTKPYVGAHFLYLGQPYKVWKVEEKRLPGYENIEPGKIVEVISEKHFIVKAGDNLIEVLDCEPIKIRVDDYL